MSTVYCPACEEPLELDDAYREWTVRCPHCGREFVPADRGRRRAEPGDDDGDDDGYVYGPEGGEREEALALVSAPAVWLEVCGWGGAVLTVLGCLLLVVAGVEEMNNGNRNGDDGTALFIFSACLGVFLLPYSVLIAVGARHLRHLSSRGWAMAAAIMCVATVPLVGCFGAVHAGLGVWALVVMEKPVVRRAFGRPGRRRREWE